MFYLSTHFANMKYIFYFIIVLACAQHCNAQLQGLARVDSLVKELPKANEDTNKVILLNAISTAYNNTNPKLGIMYGNKALELADQLAWKKGQGLADIAIGFNYKFIAEHKTALQYMYKALNIFEELKNLDGQYDCLKNLGIIYENQSAFDKALEYYQRSLVIVMKINDTLKLAKSLGNIGNLYETIHNYPKALEYSRKALQLTEQLKDINGRATCLGNIGVVYADMKEYDSALSYYNQALKLFEDIADNAGIAINLGNIGDIYYSSAKDAEEDTGRKSKSNASQTANLQLAIEYFNKSIAISKSIAQNETTMSFMESLSDAYRLGKNYPAAYETYKQYATLKDSVSSRENRAQLATIEKERELELKDHQLKIDQLRKQYIVGLFVIILLVVMGIVVNKFIKQKRSNKILAEEKRRT